MKIQVREVTQFIKTRFFIGPGTYAAEKVKVVATVKDMMSNSFTTKVSNFQKSHLLILLMLDSEILSNSSRIECLQATIVYLKSRPWHSLQVSQIHWQSV